MLEAKLDTRPLLVTLPIRVQTYDIDFASHVNNQVYIRWLEDLPRRSGGSVSRNHPAT